MNSLQHTTQPETQHHGPTPTDVLGGERARDVWTRSCAQELDDANPIKTKQVSLKASGPGIKQGYVRNQLRLGQTVLKHGFATPCSRY